MKKLFVVFEGVDGVGKTTLANKIAEMYKVDVVHNDKSLTYEDGKKNSYNYIETLRNMKTCVIDRLVHTGEAVYAPIYRGYDGSDYFEDLETKMMEEFNIIIVYVYADDETIKNRLKNRGEDYINIEDIKELKNNYNNFLSKTKIPYMIFNSSKHDAVKNSYILSLELAANINKNFNK